MIILHAEEIVKIGRVDKNNFYHHRRIRIIIIKKKKKPSLEISRLYKTNKTKRLYFRLLERVVIPGVGIRNDRKFTTSARHRTIRKYYNLRGMTIK